MFNELFTIKYNSKKFLVLTDEKHIKTFLEVNDKGDLLYPDIEDYKALYNIYNVDDLMDYKLSFDQKVRNNNKLFSLILAADILIGSAVGFTLSKNETYVERVDEIVETFGKRKIVTNYMDVVEEVLGEKEVTEEMIVEAIEKNPNMGPRYKDLANKLLDTILSVEPYFDLRIFYENISTLKIIVCDKDELKEYKVPGDAGYNVKENAIYVLKGSDDPTVCHELMHATRSLYRITDKNVLIVHDKVGESFNEAVIDEMVANIYSGYEGSHYERKILTYMLGDEDIDFEQYSKYGISYIIGDLKIKYDGVNIDYLVDYFDTKKITDSRINDTIRLEDNKKICDELFLICLHNIDPYDPYVSFKNFLQLLANYNTITLTGYQDQFEQYLAKAGILNVYNSGLEIINSKITDDTKDIKSL